jgi:hypothetical protein
VNSQVRRGSGSLSPGSFSPGRTGVQRRQGNIGAALINKDQMVCRKLEHVLSSSDSLLFIARDCFNRLFSASSLAV